MPVQTIPGLNYRPRAMLDSTQLLQGSALAYIDRDWIREIHHFIIRTGKCGLEFDFKMLPSVRGARRIRLAFQHGRYLHVLSYAKLYMSGLKERHS